MKYVRTIAVIAVMFALLYGCGGGNGGAPAARTAKITVQLEWPASSSKATRAAIPPDAYTYATIEAFVGTQRIAFASFTNPAVTAQMTLPISAVTFYVNVYTDFNTVTNTAVTNNKLEQLVNIASNQTDTETGLFPTIVGFPVLAHAIATEQVVVGSPIQFTLNNAIVSIVASSATATTFALGTTASLLENTVTAQDANGNTVVFSPNELTWQYADNLASRRALITPATPPSSPPTNDPMYTLTPLATGTVNLVVSDIRVNAGQAPIQSIVKYTIKPPVAPVTLQLRPDLLQSQCPLYAGSVQMTLTEQALKDPNGVPDPNDVPASPISVTQPVTFVATPAPSVTIPAVAVSYIYSGRRFTLTISAYSGLKGTGALLAETTSSIILGAEFLPLPSPLGGVTPPLTFTSGVYTYDPTLDPVRKSNNYFLASLSNNDYKITKIIVTPPASSIYYFNPNPAPPLAGLPTNLQLQAAISGPNIPTGTPLVINPQTVQWAPTGVTSPATVSTTGIASTNQAIAVNNATSVSITATDFRAPAVVIKGNATVTVRDGNVTIGIN